MSVHAADSAILLIGGEQDPFRRINPVCTRMVFPLLHYPEGSWSAGISVYFGPFKEGTIEFSISAVEDANQQLGLNCENYNSIWISWYGINHPATYHELSFVAYENDRSLWEGPFPTEDYLEALIGPCTYDEEGNCLRLNPELGAQQYLYVSTPICYFNCERVLLNPPDPPEPPPANINEALARYPWGIISPSGYLTLG